MKKNQPHIYKITDTRNGMQLIGQHNGRSESYITGSVIINRMIRKHGKEQVLSFIDKHIVVLGGDGNSEFGKCNIGRKRTPEHTANLIASKLAKCGGKIILTQEHKDKISKTLRNKGTRVGGQGRPFPSKPIFQYSIDGKLIKEWSSITEASLACKVQKSRIVGCAKKYSSRYRSAGGFIWRYFNS